MAKEYAKQFYRSESWEDCRKAYLSKVGGLCERCYKQGLIVPAKIVHHKCYITPENINDARVVLNHENLEALCQNCHNKEHLKRKRYSVDMDGNLIF